MREAPVRPGLPAAAAEAAAAWPDGTAPGRVATWSRTVPDGEGGGRPQEVVLGPGAAAGLPGLLAALRPRSVLVVHGRSSFAASGAAELLSGGVAGARMASFDAFGPNPTVEDVERAVAAGREAGADLVLGVGGGSAMDVAKCAAVLAPQAAPAGRCLLEPELVERPRTAGLILVPTVAGSGSEVTGFATVYVDGRKRSLDRPGMRADVAVVDPDLTRSVPAPAAVSAALDALCHAVESGWSARGTDASRAVARLALRLACRALGPAPAGPEGLEPLSPGRPEELEPLSPALGGLGVSVRGRALPEADPRTTAALAATLAGLAIDATRTTAAHAFSYPLTARFGVPHGAACALNLQWLLGYNAEVGEADCSHPLGAPFVRRAVEDAAATIGGGRGVDAAVETLRRILARGGFGWWLGAHGVRHGDVGRLVREGLASDRAGSNPRGVDPEAARAALERLVDPAAGQEGRPG